uniref:Uncharacterized protein n=1 Tax=Mycena chlorophos TaxID=658473 RepID=A0ABQ0L8Q7_MYCCL|nr:predicted protein [Mycena chlorophos]
MATEPRTATLSKDALTEAFTAGAIDKAGLLILAKNRLRTDAVPGRRTRRFDVDHKTNTDTLIEKISESDGVPYDLAVLHRGRWRHMADEVERVLQKLVDSSHFILLPLPPPRVPTPPPPPTPPPRQDQGKQDDGNGGGGGAGPTPDAEDEPIVGLQVQTTIIIRDAATQYSIVTLNAAFPLTESLDEEDDGIHCPDALAAYVLDRTLQKYTNSVAPNETVTILNSSYKGLQSEAYQHLHGKYERHARTCRMACKGSAPAEHNFDKSILLTSPTDCRWSACTACSPLYLVKVDAEVYKLDVCAIRRTSHVIPGTKQVVAKKRGRKTEPASENKRAKNTTQVELVRNQWQSDATYIAIRNV